MPGILIKDIDSMKRTIGIIELFITAIIWGTAFVAQSMGMDQGVGPCTFNGVRYAVGSIVLIPVIFLLGKLVKKEASEKPDTVITVKGGIFCGIVLAAASLLQQFGILYTTVGKAGFGTALYIIIVPFMGVILKKRIPGRVWIAAVIAIVGFYLMCISETLSINKGDLLVLLGAVMWSVHIHTVDHFAPRANGVMLSSIQFAVSSCICFIGAFLFETVSWNTIAGAAGPILYAGIMSCGVAYTLQIIGQQNVEPALACLIMSLESVVSALAGWVILGETMAFVEIVGCALVFAGVIIAQLPDKRVVSGV